MPTTPERSADFVRQTRHAHPALRIPRIPLATLNFEASQIVEHANRANIAINGIDARGLYAPEPGGDISQPSMALPPTVGLKASLRLAEQNDSSLS
jgi:hypothetical protein